MLETAARWSIAGCATLVLAAGCSHDDGSRFNPMDLVVPSYSDDDLRQIGMDADREIQQQVEIIYDPIVSGYLNELGQELASQIEPQPFIYRFRIIDAHSLNAFALPGGYIYIHAETLLRVGSVDELAGVLGHEIAHVQARHFSRREEKSALPGLPNRRSRRTYRPPSGLGAERLHLRARAKTLGRASRPTAGAQRAKRAESIRKEAAQRPQLQKHRPATTRRPPTRAPT